jgi:peroxiredoxin
MANNLTGIYDAVLQVSLPKINAILAHLHQAGMDPNAEISFPHSTSFRIDSPIAQQDVRDRVRFMKWMHKAYEHVRATTAGGDVARRILSIKAPPGFASTFEQGWHDLDVSFRPPVPPGFAVGSVHCQLSSPTVSIPPGSVSQARVHVWVRAHFEPDEGAADLPKPIHGEVRALYVATPVTVDGGPALRVRVSPNDADVEFEPAKDENGNPTVNPTQAQILARHIRAALRGPFVARDVPVPQDFASFEFKALDEATVGAPKAVVLPLSFSSAPTTGGLGSVTTNLLLKKTTSAFAVAVGRDYVKQFFDDVRDKVAAFVARIRKSVTSDIGLGTITYTPSLTSFIVNWKPGSIEVVGSITATKSGAFWGPSVVYIGFTQVLLVVLDNQSVAIRPAGPPSVSSSSSHVDPAEFAAEVEKARDNALLAANAQLGGKFAAAQQTLVSALTTFDQAASVQFAEVEVTSDGIVVRGSMGLTPRQDAVLSHELRKDGRSVTAFATWIPGGRIDGFEWTWVRSKIDKLNKKTPAPHDFICEIPAGEMVSGVAPPHCLRIEGRRLTVDGDEETVTRMDCPYSMHPPFVVVDSSAVHLGVPIYRRGDPAPDPVMNDRIAGHVSLVNDAPSADGGNANVLVHFAGPRWNRPLEGLARARGMMQRRDVSLLTILVLPTGSFDRRRSEIEERLGAVEDRVGADLVLTEDYVGGWTRTFAAPDGPSTHLVNARSEFVWRHDGELDAGAVARALDEHALPALPPRMEALRLAVEPGMRARDAVFTDEWGEHTTLRRFRGRRVLLVFWQSWSAPCLHELRRLEQVRRQRGGPSVLAVNGGEDRGVLRAVRRTHGLFFPLIYDPDQLIAARWGVRCWPTTVSINEDGIVDRVQFGLADEADEPPAVRSADSPARQ